MTTCSNCGHIEIHTSGVFYNPTTKEIVVLGVPSEDHNCDHNCDQMGCGTMDHVLMRGYLKTNLPTNIGSGIVVGYNLRGD